MDFVEELVFVSGTYGIKVSNLADWDRFLAKWHAFEDVNSNHLQLRGPTKQLSPNGSRGHVQAHRLLTV